MLAAVRALNRREVGGDTRRHACKTLAVVAPAWRRAVSPPEWRDRDARRAADDRLPTPQVARTALTWSIGRAGWQWLAAVAHAETPRRVREVPAVASWRRVWRQHDGWDGPPLHGRDADHLPPAARFLSSPDALDAPDARQPTTPGVGSTVQLTEPCEAELPPLSTPVDTAPGPTAAGAAPPTSHAALPQRGGLPGPHLGDTGVVDAARRVRSQEGDGVALLGPTRLADHWPARHGAGCDAQPCQIAGDRQRAICPAGQARIRWTPAVDHRGQAGIQGQVSTQDGRPGPT
jgi:transposase